ncbi:suppressor of fused domain protein [Paenibacillus yanchengensis]|uniref:Suppressor of fused domain protein n=1 Tax=Paenibacillus yanchengensis TaxID=2035833 RepID=A0ABW4YI42_9BACL
MTQMSLEEFKQRMQDEQFSPGWEAIETEFVRIYGEIQPAHYGTNMLSRAMFGGDQYLDGYSIYTSEKGYKHIVTFGMTELYADEKAFGGEWNRWGYEMTFKLKEEDNENCMWVLDMLSNLARYTNTQERYLEPFQYISGNGTSIHTGTESSITALFCIRDTEANTLDTVYGRTDFVQLVGITEQELNVLIADSSKGAALFELIKQDNPDLVTDMKRTKSYF